MSSVNLSYYSNNRNAFIYTLKLKLSSMLLSFNQNEDELHGAPTPNFTFHSLSLLYKHAADAMESGDLTGHDGLDVFIGEGAASRPFLKDGLNMHGIDGSARLLGNCHKKKQFKDSDLRFDKNNLILQDLSNGVLPYPDNQFSITLSAQGLMHLAEGKCMIAEMLRVTKPDGIILFDVLAHDEKQDVLEIQKPNDKSNLTLYALNGRALKADFSNENLRLLDSPIAKDFQKLDGTPIKIKHVALCLRN